MAGTDLQRSSFSPFWIAFVALAGAAGCSSSLTTLQPARTVPAGHLQIGGSVQVTPPTGLPGDTYEAVRDISGLGNNPTPAQVEQVAESATAALVQPPSLDAQASLAYGVTRRLELDARVGATSAGVGFRLQWLRRKPGIYGALGFMVNVNFQQFPVERFTDEVEIESFRRQDFAVPLVLGYSRQRVHLWAGPKLVISRFDTEVGVCLDDSCQDIRLRASGRATYVAGQFGIAIGSGRAWFALEMTVARAHVQADFDVEMPRRPSMEADTERRGRVLTPAIGLILWI
ncbi:MAG: hypothetical protein AAGE52_05145 [Myxococcota bacterium]